MLVYYVGERSSSFTAVTSFATSVVTGLLKAVKMLFVGGVSYYPTLGVPMAVRGSGAREDRSVPLI
jgi:hypothetical protein